MEFNETLDELENYNQDNTDFFSFNGDVHLAKVVKCYDGDTIHCIFKYNNKYHKFKIRMYGYDSPEMKPSRKIEKSIRRDIKLRAKKARDTLADMILNKVVILECLGFDKYGRLLANVKINENDEKTVNEIMIELGHGEKYDGGTK